MKNKTATCILLMTFAFLLALPAYGLQDQTQQESSGQAEVQEGTKKSKKKQASKKKAKKMPKKSKAFVSSQE